MDDTLEATLTAEVEAAVPIWLTVPEVGELMGIEITRVRQLLREGKLLAVRRGENNVLSIPAELVTPDGPVKGLPGTVTLLRDARYGDLEALHWLYRQDDSLPGTPAQALAENRGTEVKRRAQALGF